MPASLQDRCRVAALRAVDWITSLLDSDGGLGPACTDLSCYYKVPYLMHLAGRPGDAHRLLETIARRFLQRDGDFLTARDCRTADPVLASYPAYMSGWIAMAAHKLGRFSLSYPAWHHLLGFWSEAPPGFTLHPHGSPMAGFEVLTCAHLGLLALYFGDLERACGAGLALRRFLDLQSSLPDRLFLRMTGDQQLVSEFPDETAPLYVVDAHRPGQAWFFIGYPIAFLCRLHQATGEPEALKAARAYGAFAEACRPRMVAEHFAHKVAWGAAELAAATGEASPRSLCEDIVGHLLMAQGESGDWMGEAPLSTRLDQSAEVAIWLLEISAIA
ncbi:MAG: hypothetical protein VKO65_05260 [Cyanobacteriota bacterium]|nr:hypothetical protein [Cyanobacteriota bacterium]